MSWELQAEQAFGIYCRPGRPLPPALIYTPLSTSCIGRLAWLLQAATGGVGGSDSDSAPGRVLIHCSQGVSRSASLAIAYLMWKRAAGYDDVFQEVKAARGVANPNIGFICQVCLPSIMWAPLPAGLPVCLAVFHLRLPIGETAPFLALRSCCNGTSGGMLQPMRGGCTALPPSHPQRHST